ARTKGGVRIVSRNDRARNLRLIFRRRLAFVPRIIAHAANMRDRMKMSILRIKFWGAQAARLRIPAARRNYLCSASRRTLQASGLCSPNHRKSQSRIARELRIRQSRPAKEKLIGANAVGREKIVAARRADDVVLIDPVAADANRADERAVSIKWKAAGENCDSVRQRWIQSIAGIGRGRRHGGEDNVRFGPGKSRESILFGEKWAGTITIDSRRIIFLREKSDGAGGKRDVRAEANKIVSRIKNRGARFLHRYVPAEHRRFAGAESSENSRRNSVHVRIVHDGDEDLHLRADGQTNSGARDFH